MLRVCILFNLHNIKYPLKSPYKCTSNVLLNGLDSLLNNSITIPGTMYLLRCTSYHNLNKHHIM